MGLQTARQITGRTGKPKNCNEWAEYEAQYASRTAVFCHGGTLDQSQFAPCPSRWDCKKDTEAKERDGKKHLSVLNPPYSSRMVSSTSNVGGYPPVNKAGTYVSPQQEVPTGLISMPPPEQAKPVVQDTNTVAPEIANMFSGLSQEHMQQLQQLVVQLQQGVQATPKPTTTSPQSVGYRDSLPTRQAPPPPSVQYHHHPAVPYPVQPPPYFPYSMQTPYASPTPVGAGGGITPTFLPKEDEGLFSRLGKNILQGMVGANGWHVYDYARTVDLFQ